MLLNDIERTCGHPLSLWVLDKVFLTLGIVFVLIQLNPLNLYLAKFKFHDEF